MSSCGSPSFAFGTQLSLSVTFTNPATSGLVDPTDVAVSLQFAGFSPQTFYYSSGAVQRVSQGTYSYTFTPASGGYWQYAWEGTGTVQASTPNGSFNVTTNLFG